MNNLFKLIKNNRLFIIILALSIFLRLYKLGSLPPPIHIDEALMGKSAISILDRSSHLFSTHYSITTIGNILTTASIKVFGVSPVSLRLSSVLIGVLTNIFIYLFIKDLFNKKMALIAMFLGSVFHLSIAYSRLNLLNIQTPFLLVLNLYLLNKAINKQNEILFILGGIVSGLSLYSYTGAKAIILITIIFMIINFRKINFKSCLLYLFGIFISILPLLIYLQNPGNNYFQRENETFVLNNQEYWQSRWHTKNLKVFLYKQLTTNLSGLFSLNDNSNQYGNGPLLDKLSGYLFIISLFFTPFLLLDKKKKFYFFFLFVFFLIIFAISLTESPPLSTRLIILYPLIIIIISILLDLLSDQLKNKNIKKVFIAFILTTIFFFNVKIYFFDYMNKKNAYYQWIEPNSSIALYLNKKSSKNIFLLSNPHTYPNHTITEVLTYDDNKNIKEIKNENDIEEIFKLKESVMIITPLVPVESLDDNLNYLKDIIIEKAKMYNFKEEKIKGIPCKECNEEDIFLVFKKTF